MQSPLGAELPAGVPRAPTFDGRSEFRGSHCGVSVFGQVAFVAYGVAVVFFPAVVNGVGNVPRIYIDNARALGASRSRLDRTVILPAILPEMRTAVLLALGTSWAAVIGAEFLTAQSGLGFVVVYSQQFGYLDRMFLIALIIVAYASLSFWAANTLFSHLTRWAQPSA